MRSLAWLALTGWLAAAPAQADRCKALDGDTLQCGPERVRLYDVYAAEMNEAGGAEAKRNLQRRVNGKDVELHRHGHDRYGRTLAVVTCGGIDANAEQVRQGMGWVYRKYAPKDSPLYAVEDDAKAAKRGLWADAEPVPPWEWRKEKSKD